jgi:hypothetical protein
MMWSTHSRRIDELEIGGDAMCEKCVEDERRIVNYQQLAGIISDQKALDAIDHQIMELRSAKAKRHLAREE